MQIDLSAAFDRANHLGILYKPLICGYCMFCVVNINTVLSNLSHHVMMDGCLSKLSNVVSGVPQGMCFWPIIVPARHLGFFSHIRK